MNETDKKILKISLNKIIEGDLNCVQHKSFGLCNYLEGYIRLICAYDFVYYNSRGWKHHSGNDNCPVPHVEGVGLWEGENLEMRQDLCKYLLAKLESM
jgi:hypothetical protein